eukprot:scaffold1220_cov259-Pinguiococcus_pyrenoidosus.AAC.97
MQRPEASVHSSRLSHICGFESSGSASAGCGTPQLAGVLEHVWGPKSYSEITAAKLRREYTGAFTSLQPRWRNASTRAKHSLSTLRLAEVSEAQLVPSGGHRHPPLLLKRCVLKQLWVVGPGQIQPAVKTLAGQQEAVVQHATGEIQ